jgi:hypothetical protein
MTVFSHAARNSYVDKLKLKINFNKAEKISELFTTKLEIAVNSTLFLALIA